MEFLQMQINVQKNGVKEAIITAKEKLEADSSDERKYFGDLKIEEGVLIERRDEISFLMKEIGRIYGETENVGEKEIAKELYQREYDYGQLDNLQSYLKQTKSLLTRIHLVFHPQEMLVASRSNSSVCSKSTQHSTLSHFNQPQKSVRPVLQLAAGDCPLLADDYVGVSSDDDSLYSKVIGAGRNAGYAESPAYNFAVPRNASLHNPVQAIEASEFVIQRKVERVKPCSFEPRASSRQVNGYGSSDERKNPTSRFTMRSKSPDGRFVESPRMASDGITTLAQQLLSARLPELKVPVFDGEPTLWLEFWEAFQSSVHQKPLSDAEKLAYLKGYLDGDAKKAIEGYTCGRFYQDAIDTLQEQFGKTHSIVRSFKRKLNEVKPPESSYKSLRHFVNDINCICRQLKTLGFDPNGNDSIEDMVYEKLPVGIQKTIIRKKNQSFNFGLKAMMDLLEEELDVLKEFDERKVLSNKNGTQSEKKPDVHSSQKFTDNSRQRNEGLSQKFTDNSRQRNEGFSRKFTDNSRQRSEGFSYPRNENFPSQKLTDSWRPTNGRFDQRKRKPCIFCQQEKHPSSMCPRFTTIDGRRAELAKQKRCCKCLNEGHDEKSCAKVIKCYICNGQNHNASLCEDNDTIQISQTTALMSKTVCEKKNATLMSAKGIVKNPKTGKSQVIVILLDCGSSRSFVTKKIAKDLQLPVIERELLSIQSFGGKTKQQSSNLHELALMTSKGEKILQVNSTDRICHKIEVAKVALAEGPTSFTVFEEPDIVIGNDYFCDFIIKVKKDHGTTILETIIGDIIVGEKTVQKQVNVNFAISTEKEVEDWQYEAAGFAQEDTDDSIALDMFEKSKRLVDKRFEVGFPWKPTKRPLPSNLGLSYGRLKSVHKNLKEHPQRLLEYDGKFKEQVEQEIIEEVEGEGEDDEIIHYLPHHPIFNPEKPTTKLRIVFDGSAKTCKNNPSINECMFKEKKLLPDLVGILLRTRMFKYLLTGDIEKAFHQIGIRKEDRNACRFLWLKDITKGLTKDNIIYYRFRRIPFGFICSPFLLAAILLFWFLQFCAITGKQLFNNTYVDNVFLLLNSKTEAIELREKLCDHFLNASMNLREWLSNDKEIVESVPPNLRQKAETFTKILGVKWNFQTDEYIFSLDKSEVQLWTRRKMLTWIMGAFDPLGFLLPVTTRFKVFLQSVWQNTSSWDIPLTSKVIEEWTTIMNDSIIPEQSVPRLIKKNFDETKNELHVFCDASKDSYAAVVYLKNGDHCNLIFAKSKVKPLKKTKKQLTIPEMELLGATLGAVAIQYVEKQLQQEIPKKCLWTDSMTVWNWLHNCKDSRFVANRVSKIHEANCEYFFVPTKSNPADIPTRGILGTSLASCTLWWKGPDWLAKNEASWPKQPEPPKFVETDVVLVIETNDALVEPILDTTRFSSCTKLLRVTATLLRACKKFKSFLSLPSDCVTVITANDLIEAETILVQREQQIAAENLSKACETEVNKNGFMIFKNRMHKAEKICHEPILLPAKAHLTKLYVLYIHKKLFHAGGPHTLAEMRKKYWIIKGRAVVKNTLKRDCFACKRFLSKPFKLPPMPMLPVTRVNEDKAFSHIGLDYFGPVNVKTNDKGKRWVLLITCFVTRALHLEVVNDLTSKAFIRAFRRYVARRGVPRTILSDNSKTFILASKVLENLWKEICSSQLCLDFFTNSKIEWKFIAEKAPWQGGLYERLVKSVKIPLKAAVGRKWMEEDEFSTLLVEIENMVNSRPLLYVDDESPHILCPANLIGYQPTWYFKEEFESDDENDPDYGPTTLPPREGLIRLCKNEWKKLDIFWKTWNDQYLNLLREKQIFQHKATRGSNSFPQQDEVVIVQDDQIPRSYWKLAKIKELLHGDDGECRSALIEFSNGNQTRRPLNALYPMEINISSPRECGDSSVTHRQ